MNLEKQDIKIKKSFSFFLVFKLFTQKIDTLKFLDFLSNIIFRLERLTFSKAKQVSPPYLLFELYKVRS